MIQKNKNKNTNKDVIKPEKFSQHYKSNDEKKTEINVDLLC